jgi:DNA-binding GntR family transcriptional regulator
MRLMIDTSVGKLLARQLTERQIHTLARLLEKLVKLVDGAAYVDYGAYLECDRAFHSAIVQMLGNSRLTALYEEINLPLWLVRAQQDAGAPRDARDSLAEHQAIWAALAARDPHAAAEAMAAHIESSLGKLGVQLTPADHDELVNSHIPWR